MAWTLSRYAWVVVAFTLGLAGAPLVLAGSDVTYQAEALVIAQSLTMSEKALPSVAEQVFDGGAVAAAVARDPAVTTPADELIPGLLSVVPARDSIVLTVEARDPDPETAARMADLAAAEFVDELNRSGAGVGQFALHQTAAVPTDPLREISPVLWAVAGGVAGLLLGLGVVALIAVIRRPLVTTADVSGAVGAPLLGSVQLAIGRRTGYPGPLGVPGIATVTRKLAAVPADRLLMISSPSASAVRQRIFVMAAVALSTVRGLRFEAPQHLVDAIEQHRTDLRTAGRPVKQANGTADEMVLVDGGSALELVDPAATRVSVVAVLPRGTPRRRLQSLASDYVDSGLVGVVLVDVRARFRSTGARRARSASAPRRLAGAVEPVTLPEPEPERA